MKNMRCPKRLVSVRGFIIVFIACVAASGCGSNPTSTQPTPSAGRTVTAVSISGPASPASGSVTSYTATATYSDGTTQDVTATASWASSTTNVCQVSATGVVTTVTAGTCDLSASVGTVRGTLRLTVPEKPAPTFVIQGQVHETAPTQSTAVPNARIEIVGGPLASQVFTTGADGRFVLPAVSAPGFDVYIKRQGYEDFRYHVGELPRDATADIALMPEAGQVNVTFSGPDQCVLPTFETHLLTLSGRTFAAMPVHRDGTITIFNYLTHFSIGAGAAVYRLDPDEAVRLADFQFRTVPFPVAGGHTYFFAAGGDIDFCNVKDHGPLDWSVTVSYPK